MLQSNSPARRTPGIPRIVVAGGAIVAIAVFAADAAPRPLAPPSPVAATGAAGMRALAIADAADTDRLAVNNVVYQGWKMFEVYCTRCHGEDAVGSSFAPALRKSVGPSGTIDHKAFFQTVTNGRPGKGMPTWGNLLSPEQKEDIWNYLRALAVGGLGNGRPHLKPGASRDSTVLPPKVGQDTTWPGPTS
jgi:mono/diheme cytochrome c family protein